jgi:hypothetical protein
VRQFALPACLLTPADLRRLYRLFAQKASEAADQQIATLVIQPGQSARQLEEMQEAHASRTMQRSLSGNSKAGD